MITHLKGKLIERTPTYVVIECNGVGYFVKISLNTYSSLPLKGDILIYTQLQIREDAHTLYGFHQKSDREMFNHLVSVSGIGANTAILMLSALTADEIANAIVSENVDTIKSIKGIGLKTAQRVIVDLKSKMEKVEFSVENIFNANNTTRFEALSALSALGFDKKKAELAIQKVIGEDQTVEQLIKEALRIL
ncbi:Holliday junction branch migration protein RuvA [Putridiphycobacter roseus]|uniref:Holliday junction branch migration complex subunit RuvA n=1 Tax=Putridiphycobacter roseus TaxID=2219161 RepID=A0A2W1NQZ6_9FLAO|nr:Holliday junction branch migration protein RuvA [Putridiphycobacter roseus]PZE17098.1 Holliday junction branch migration protein RuvA [Putridiphycobacter roseus]